MAAVILFALIIAAPSAYVYGKTAKNASILSGKGGEDTAVDEQTAAFLDTDVFTLCQDSLLGYNIPSGSPDLVFNKKDATVYIVLQGDTLSQIADKFGISLNTLLWANKLTIKSAIHIGDKLEILPISGTKHIVKKGENVSLIAKKYGVDVDRIVEFNDLPSDAAIGIGDELIIPGGAPPAVPAPKKTSYATVSPGLDISGYFIYPTSGRNWGILHNVNAVDIANACKTPIYAAAGGTVSLVDEVGWNSGYGKYMTITHPNGVKTLYAHFSDIVASNGSEVTQGDLIGYMGTTGHSTGCHLHFEVRGAKNPFVR